RHLASPTINLGISCGFSKFCTSRGSKAPGTRQRAKRTMVSWRQGVLLVASAVLALCHAVHGAYNIGVGKGDITGPAAEVVMMGYADSKQKSAGVLNRLYARAFVIEDADTNERVLFVNCDLAAVFQLVHQEVIKQLKSKYAGTYSEQNVVLHAIHTHAGPGGTSAYFLYDVSILGYINENFDVIVSGIMKAIEAAHDSVAPGSIRFNMGKIANGGKNRSPLAYAANPEEEKAQYDGDHDTDMRMLQFLDKNDKLRGILAFFPVHPTSLTQHNFLVSGDNKGYAEFLLEQKLDGVIAAIGISNAADVSPNLIDNGDGTFRGEGKTDVESAEIMGTRQANKALELLDSKSELVEGNVVGKLSYVDYSNVKIKDANATSNGKYGDRTCPALVGQNFGAGTEDGRGVAGLTEGELKANPLYQAIGGVIKEAPSWVKECHTANKVPLLATGSMSPVPWTPEILPLQVVKIGQIGLAITNFEVSTMSGRRIRKTVKAVLKKAGVTQVEVVSISNAYAQYLTTREEYMKQHYEGASTLFGPNQLAAVQQELARVAESVADSSVPLDKGPSPRQFDRSKLVNVQTGVVMDTVPLGKSFGDVRSDAKSSYSVGDTVSVDFYGAHPKNRLGDVSSFCDVEKEVDGKWETVMTDAHWDVRFRWSRKGVSESKSTCEWFIREGNPTSEAGRYRLRHRGYHKPAIGDIASFDGTSAKFTSSLPHRASPANEMVSPRFLVQLLALVVFVVRAADAAYRIGIGKADVTGPAAEVVMMGFADTSQKTAGILNRLYARAFLVEDTTTSRRVVFVNCDIHSISQLVHQEVLRQLKAKFADKYTEQNVVLHAIHTHSGPGGTHGYFLYDVSILGFISENFDVIVSGIVNAIALAHNSMEPGAVRFSIGSVPNGGKNRSPDAYAQNPLTERAQYAGDRDTDLRMLQFLAADGKLRGILAFYPVHGTSLKQSNTLISGDNKGYAEFFLEDKLPGVVAAIGISNAGDVSPNTIDNHDGTFRGEGQTDIESAEIIGSRQAMKVLDMLKGNSSVLEGLVVGKATYVDFSQLRLENASSANLCRAVVGQNFGAGTEDGRGLSSFTEVSLKSNPLYVAIGATIKSTPASVQACQSPKVPLLATGLITPIPWTPEVLPVQVLRIGQFAIAVVPFEVTTMAGRRIRNAVGDVLKDVGVTNVEIASLSNAYAQYTTTSEEYSKQDYEGASTLFGPNQLLGLQQELVRVASSAATLSTIDVGPLPRQIDRSKLINFQTGVVVDGVPLWKQFGDVRSDVKSSYSIGAVASVVFYGAHPKNRFTEVRSFCDVEKSTAGSGFVTVLTDAHWDVRFLWERTAVSDSKSTCQWYIRAGNPTSTAGRYRIRHRGYYKSLLGDFTYYDGTSAIFTVG
ncbi:TPA: hypothetical protein N0F65_003737, partial [Lagenidium giganteum]